MTKAHRARLIFTSIAVAFVCAALLLTALFAVQSGRVQAASALDGSAAPAPSPSSYTPPPLEAAAVPLAQAGLAGDAQTLRNENYAAALRPPFALAQDGSLRVDFANPADNSVWLMLDLRLTDSGLLLHRTGRVGPGEALPSLALCAEAVDLLREQGPTADVTLVIYSFDYLTYTSMGEMRLSAPVLTGVADGGETVAPGAGEGAQTQEPSPTPLAPATTVTGGMQNG